MTGAARKRSVAALAALLMWSATVCAQGLTVRGRVSLVGALNGKPAADNSQAIVWLTPLDDPQVSWTSATAGGSGRFRLVQKNKRFTPHILVVPVGAVVEFPNDDPFFHNVFSLFDGKRFDLGLYEAGTTKTVTFNTPGVSYIFCNIHPEMSAVVLVTRSPYYAISNSEGEFAISNVRGGRYQLSVWHERCLPETLRMAAREISVSDSTSSLGEIRLAESGDLLAKHKNKFGQGYEPVPSSAPGYDQP
jgi:plastocyanin